MSETVTLSYPLNISELEQLPHNKRRSKAVTLARSLDTERQAEFVSDLCQSRSRSKAIAPTSSLTLGTPSSSSKTKSDLAFLLDGDNHVGDPTVSYHLQEIGLLVAASVATKEKLLEFCKDKTNKLICDKALALAIHSSCVSDNDIRDLFTAANERDKRKIVRACARESLRENLNNEFIFEWLKQTDDRRILACEILHNVKVGTKWLGTKLKEIILRGKAADLSSSTTIDSKKKFAVDGACYKALRRDLLWKRHASNLVSIIQHDLDASRSLLHNAEIFDFWDSFLQVHEWKVPGSQRKPNAQRQATAASFVPWKMLLTLYLDHIPFRPSSASVDTVWKQKLYKGIVTDRSASNTLDLLLPVEAWDRTWNSSLTLVIPSWIASDNLLRGVTAEELFVLVNDRVFDASTGMVKPGLNNLATSLLNRVVPRIQREVSKPLFSGVMAMTKNVLSMVTPAVFYSGRRNEEFYATREEYLFVEQVVFAKDLLFKFIESFLVHPKLSTGQQLEMFLELHAFSKRMLLRPEDFSNPLQLILPRTIKDLLAVYQKCISSFTDIILGSVSKRINHAADRGMRTDQLSTVFSKVVELGVTGVQEDIEHMYAALAKPFPAVFGIIPVREISDTILPRILSYSRQRRFEISSDVASRIVNHLFLTKVLPMVRKDTFGDEALFSDRPGRLMAKLIHRKDDVGTRARALENMEPIRLEWFHSMCKIAQALRSGVLSVEATDAFLTFLEDWTTLASDSFSRAMEAKRWNRHSLQGLSPHPESASNAETSLQSIVTFCKTFMVDRVAMFNTESWRDPKQEAQVRLIQRAFRIWSAAKFPTDGYDPCKSEIPGKLDPYMLDPWIRQACSLPHEAVGPFLPVIRSLFALRLNGKIQISSATTVQAPPSNFRKANQHKDIQPWDDTAELFRTIFITDSTTWLVKKTAQDVVDHLERLGGEQRASQSFLKLLEKYLDISKPHNRKRLEQDLTRPLFADRLTCMQVMLSATTRTGSIAEVTKTMARLAKSIENESRDNRMQVLRAIFSEFFHSAVALALPQATGAGNKADREFAQFLISPPKEEDWPSILEAAEKLPVLLYKLLDDLVDSSDEKSEQDLKLFRTASDELFRRSLTWACSIDPHADERIRTVLKKWHDCAMELQWRLAIFKSGKGQAGNTFRPMITGTTITAVRAFLLEVGFQCDKPWPKGAEEFRAFEAEASERRKAKALFLAGLFEDAYRTRIGEPPALGTPLGRKPAMEKKRIKDLVDMVQGEWVYVASVAERFADVVSQVSNRESTRNHQNQVHDIAKVLTEASVAWGVKCRDARPPWADRIVKVEMIVREQRRGASASAATRTVRRRGKFGKLGRGGNKTKAVNLAEEDAPWAASRYFRFIPEIISEYWNLSLQTFGIHHPAGVEAGRSLLRMYLRWNFYKADAAFTRAQRQTIRCDTALGLLDMCPSAVHLKVVQAVLKDFRQDLLERHVLDKDPSDAILGKFSDMSPVEADDEGADDDDEDGDDDDNAGLTETKMVKPFRLGGFYGFGKLTAPQGEKLAKSLVNDLTDPGLSTVERNRCASKLTFIPAVGFEDLTNVLVDHFARKTAYAEAIRKKKKDGTEVTVVPPLPEGVVETLFHAVLSDSNPQAMLSLLNPTMMRMSSTKTTILVAQRAVLLLNPIMVAEIVRILLNRKGRDGLLIGPVKAFLRILFNIASQHEGVIGHDVITKALEILKSQWDRNDLHQDARAVMVNYSLKALSHSLSPKNEAFAWSVLEDVATNPNISSSLRSILLSAEPPSSAFPETSLTTITPASQEMKTLVQEAMRFDKAIITQDNARFLDLLIKAIVTCATIEAQAKQRTEEAGNDRRKRGLFNRQSVLAQDIRALLYVNLIRWMDSSSASYDKVLPILRGVILSLPDERRTDENQGREMIATKIVPKRFGELLSGAFSAFNRTVFSDPGAATKAQEVLKPLLDGLVGEIPLSAFNKRRQTAIAVASLTSALSKEGGKQSLYRLGFSVPFRNTLLLLKRAAELSDSINSFTPSTLEETVDED